MTNSAQSPGFSLAIAGCTAAFQMDQKDAIIVGYFIERISDVTLPGF
jgi:hypothetical protein